MNIEALDKHLKLYRDKYKLEHGMNDKELSMAMMVKLQEEVGELADAVLGFHGLQRDGKNERYSQVGLTKEFVDVLTVLINISKVMKVDMQGEIDKRMTVTQVQK